MSNSAAIPPRSEAQTPWTSTQAYVLAVFCLLLGVALGYLFRGSASPGTTMASSTPANNLPQGMDSAPAQPTPEQLKQMFAQAASPLLDALNKNPNDFDSLVKVANLAYDSQLYPDAIQYYQRALKIHPDNADVRTDLGTAYWYTGDADKAIAEFQKSLKVRPDHPGTLFNLGVVKWQGKMDPAGAVAVWQELLQRNPNYPQKQQVEEFIAKARQHASKG
jgi:cytochrome c-type biogenesis protein CcmH/NrfG